LLQFFLSSDAVWIQTWYNINQTTCTSAPIQTQLYPDNTCLFKSFGTYLMFSCSGNTVITKTYNNSLCSGSPTTSTSSTSGQCNTGVIQNCGSVPYPYYGLKTFTTPNCQGAIGSSIVQMNLCVQSGNVSAMTTCTSNGLLSNKIWNTTNCSGPVIGAIYEPAYSCLSSGVSSTSLFCGASGLASPVSYSSIIFNLYPPGFLCNATAVPLIYATDLCYMTGSTLSYLFTCNGNSATINIYNTTDCTGTNQNKTTTPLNVCTTAAGLGTLIVTACESSGTLLRANLILFCLFYFFTETWSK